MAAKPAGFFKRSADEISRLSKIGAESLPLRVHACLRLLTVVFFSCSLEYRGSSYAYEALCVDGL